MTGWFSMMTGTIWMYTRGAWTYITSGADGICQLASWDARVELPEGYAPYTVLDGAAQQIVRGSKLIVS